MSKLYDLVKCRLQNLQINCFFGRCPLAASVVDVGATVAATGVPDDVRLMATAPLALSQTLAMAAAALALPITLPMPQSIGDDSNDKCSSPSNRGKSSTSFKSVSL